jgi:hypothetical protein
VTPTEAAANQRRDLAEMVQHALGFRVSCDGPDSYHVERLYWYGKDEQAMVRVTGVRPASQDEYRMYDLLCTPHADWPSK